MFRLWLDERASWSEIKAMSLNELDLLNLALDAHEDVLVRLRKGS